MRRRSWGAALAIVVLAGGVVGCSTTPDLDVTSVDFTPAGQREPTVSTANQEPFILPDGVAGTIDVYFFFNRSPGSCTLTLDGVHSLTAAPARSIDLGTYVVRLTTSGLAVDRSAEGALACQGASEAFGAALGDDRFSVATKKVIVAHLNTGQIDFPTTQVGAPPASPQGVDGAFLINVGSLRASVVAVRVSGPGAAHFRITGNECSGATLGREQSCLVGVEFAPRSAGAQSAILEFELVSADPKVPDRVTPIVLLRGTATPAPSAEPTPVPPHHGPP